MHKGSFILLAMLLLPGLLRGTSLDLSDKGDWRQPERIELHQGFWRIQGAGKFMTWDTQPISKGRRYTLSLQVRRPGLAARSVLFWLYPMHRRGAQHSGADGQCRIWQ